MITIIEMSPHQALTTTSGLENPFITLTFERSRVVSIHKEWQGDYHPLNKYAYLKPTKTLSSNDPVHAEHKRNPCWMIKIANRINTQSDFCLGYSCRGSCFQLTSGRVAYCAMSSDPFKVWAARHLRLLSFQCRGDSR